MNWLFLLVILYLAFEMVRGYRLGLLFVCFSVASWLIIASAVSAGTPYVEDFLLNNTQMKADFSQSVKEEWDLQKNGQGDWQITNKENQNQELENTLPQILVMKLLEQSGIYEEVVDRIAGAIVHGLASIITFLGVSLACILVGILLKKANKLPGFGRVNSACGLVAGGAKGIILLWIVLAILPYFASTDWGQWILSYIYEAPALAYLYENNLILEILLAVFHL